MIGSGQIKWFAVPTRSRPELLARAIASYQENFEAAGRKVKFLVSDDTSDDHGQAKNVAVLRAIMQKAGEECWYLGPKEKDAWVEPLALASDVPLDTVRFALFGAPDWLPSYGANRNAILLSTLDDKVICSDDDTVCRVGTAFESGADSFAFQNAGRSSPEETWVFADRSAALQSMCWQDLSLLDCHERLLGRPLAEFIEGGPGRIGLVTSGVVGDCGMASSLGVQASANEATRARLLSSERAYRQGIASREIVRQARRLAVSRHAGLIMTCFSADHSEALPPFLPTGRNEDGVFGAMIMAMLPELHLGHLPVSLLHDPCEVRAYDARLLWVRLSDCFFAAILDWKKASVPEEGGVDSMASLAEYLRQLSLLAISEFTEQIHALLATYSARRLLWLVTLLESRDFRPSFWAHDIKRAVTLLERSITDRRFSVPQELMSAASAHDAMLLLRQLIRQYGQLLSCWPAIVGALRSGKLPHGAIRL